VYERCIVVVLFIVGTGKAAGFAGAAEGKTPGVFALLSVEISFILALFSRRARRGKRGGRRWKNLRTTPILTADSAFFDE
jgi:hypothetical protein